MEYILSNGGKGEETKVVFGPKSLNGLNDLAQDHTKVAVITDDNSAHYCLEKIKAHLPEQMETILLSSGEDNKTVATAENILKQLREAGCDRKSLVIGLGGGVVSDIAGFAASTYMRGIDWVMIPTTLIAQADASIGAKTGVNLDGYKNMMGSFWPPKAVLIYPGFLKTLPKEHLNNGLAEIIKMGFIYDKTILDNISGINPASPLGEELNRACELAAKAKIDIVNRDMFESGERKLLNFGHTMGHALESLSLETNTPLLHGEAISIGMVAETRLAELEGLCGSGLVGEVSKTLQRFDLPVSYPAADAEKALKRIAADKKNVGENIYWTLPRSAGKGIFNHIAADTNIKTAISSVL